MKEISDYISNITRIEPMAYEHLLNAFESKTFKKGELILRADQACRHFYFIKEGLIKSHFYKDDKEFIMTFFKENMLFTEISSYVTGQPSKYMMMALEDTIVYSISKTNILSLCEKHHTIETLFSKLFSFATLNMMKRISEMLEEDATRRYTNFRTEHNQVLQRISLGDLSGYLGITQVSLSRIRAKK